jgi:hypothetical protein
MKIPGILPVEARHKPGGLARVPGWIAEVDQ